MGGLGKNLYQQGNIFVPFTQQVLITTVSREKIKSTVGGGWCKVLNLCETGKGLPKSKKSEQGGGVPNSGLFMAT